VCQTFLQRINNVLTTDGFVTPRLGMSAAEAEKISKALWPSAKPSEATQSRVAKKRRIMEEQLATIASAATAKSSPTKEAPPLADLWLLNQNAEAERRREERLEQREHEERLERFRRAELKEMRDEEQRRREDEQRRREEEQRRREEERREERKAEEKMREENSKQAEERHKDFMIMLASILKGSS
jgi:hypothetical protein